MMRRAGMTCAVRAACGLRAGSQAFGDVAMGMADPILGLSVAYNNDTSPSKVNLGVGVYRDDNGLPFVLPSVRRAELRVCEQSLDHEYAPISGLAGFVSKAQKLAFGGDSAVVAEKRIASSQTLSGTGALRIAGEFMNRFGKNKKLMVPNPTWGNHHAIFKDAGLEVEPYCYYSPKSKGIDFEGMIADFEKQAPGTIILLHACAHNPSGNDPTEEQWRTIVEVIKRKQLFPLVDMAYQGFASGDLNRDAFGLRLLASEVEALVLCQSFAKSFGLYGQRTGAVHFMCADAGEAECVLSQLKILIRPIYSNPPLYGARVVDTVLGDAELTTKWEGDLKDMADRMNGVRSELVKSLEAAGSVKDWSHILNQIGMMAFTGLSKAQVAQLKADHHIYMTDDGRAAISGLNSRNVEYVARAFHDVSK